MAKKVWEDPQAIQEARQRLEKINWNDDTAQPIITLFQVVDTLVEREIFYYYRRRKSARLMSQALLLCAWIAGIFAVVLPILSPAIEGGPELTAIGPIAVVLAAAFAAGNRLFGGTSGHVRYVSTQLALEALSTKSRIELAEVLAKWEDFGSKQLSRDKGLEVARNYSSKFYSIVGAETEGWGGEVLAEARKLSSDDREKA